MTGAGISVMGMGDYAFYVWGSFGLMLMAIGGEVVLLLRRRRAQRHDNGNAARSSSE